MPSLLDIAPPEIAGKEVDIRGTKLPIAGIAAIDWAKLYARFPELRAVVSGRETPGEDNARNVQMMLAQCALIAAGTGHPGDAEVERAAMVQITREEQAMLAEEIIRLSNPGDVFSPLLDGPPAANGVDRGHSIRAPATK
jgi:hypothetical protein